MAIEDRVEEVVVVVVVGVAVVEAIGVEEAVMVVVGGVASVVSVGVVEAVVVVVGGVASVVSVGVVEAVVDGVENAVSMSRSVDLINWKNVILKLKLNLPRCRLRSIAFREVAVVEGVKEVAVGFEEAVVVVVGGVASVVAVGVVEAVVVEAGGVKSGVVWAGGV